MTPWLRPFSAVSYDYWGYIRSESILNSDLIMFVLNLTECGVFFFPVASFPSLSSWFKVAG